MPVPVDKSRVIHFGVFEVDFQEAELRKSGVRIRLQMTPGTKTKNRKCKFLLYHAPTSLVCVPAVMISPAQTCAVSQTGFALVFLRRIYESP